MLLKGETYNPDEEAAVIKSVVARQLHKMDQNFLAVIDAYSKQTRKDKLEISKLIDKVMHSIGWVCLHLRLQQQEIVSFRCGGKS